MIQQQNHYGKLWLFPFLFTIVASCEKDKNSNMDSPAHYIAESEKLIIPAAIEIPANLPGGNARVATYYAAGVQKYKAQAKAGSNPVTYEWAFVAPEADLYDASNKKIGNHSAGPTWQLSAMDSIYGQHFSPAKTTPSPDGSIDWLLLMPKNGKTPTGIFANVSYIQRIVTQRGKAPAVMPQSATETSNVPYTAIYRFTKKN
ncbi:MAG: DUF3455 domain-containing protein [Chitinophagaceae bacterium]|nr:DUF3455 domain-containing protein [Chitinophagaceae bacterium]